MRKCIRVFGVTTCLKCGSKYAYTSFQWQECPNSSCENYKENLHEPNFLHHVPSDFYLGQFEEDNKNYTYYVSIFDLYLSSDLKTIRARFGNDRDDYVEDLVSEINIDDGYTIDDCLVEGLKRARKLFKL